MVARETFRRQNVYPHRPTRTRVVGLTEVQSVNTKGVPSTRMLVSGKLVNCPDLDSSTVHAHAGVSHCRRFSTVNIAVRPRASGCEGLDKFLQDPAVVRPRARGCEVTDLLLEMAQRGPSTRTRVRVPPGGLDMHERIGRSVYPASRQREVANQRHMRDANAAKG